MLEDESNRPKITKPIVVPTGVNKTQVKKLIKQEKPEPVEDVEDVVEKIEDELDELDKLLNLDEIDKTSQEEEKPKRGRGRPRKIVPEGEQKEEKPKRGRGRPRKNPIPEEISKEEESDDESIDLFNLDDSTENKEVEKQETASNDDELVDLFDLENETSSEEDSTEEDVDLFNLEDQSKTEEDVDLFNLEDQSETEEDDVDLFELADDNEPVKNDNNLNNNIDSSFSYDEDDTNTDIAETQYKPIESNFAATLTKDKKVVCFVGTTKNGTSFVVNNAAHLLSSMGISTAILDMTKTRNAYYIYTNSEEHLMKTAKNSINKLRSGIADGVKVNKNLTVYTSLPEDETEYKEVDAILSTLAKNYSVVLIDCDFDTPMEYFGAAQEIYLVQSMDVLTIQPLTAFLRNMQSKGVLRQEKLKIIINKSVNIKSVSIKTLIGGISKYNDPSMSFMKDLFDKDKVPYCVIPFEVQNYVKYLDALITCTISLNGYTKGFMSALKELCNMIYPLINRQTYSPRGDRYKSNFSNEMNDTLNKMKRKYQ